MFLRHFVHQPSADPTQNFTKIVPGEPYRQVLNARGVAKYSDIGPVEGYISQTVQDRPRVQLMTNRKSYS